MKASMGEARKCNVCNESKPLDCFHVSAYQCKACRAKVTRQYRAENAERIAAVKSAWKRSNKERSAEKLREWRRANPGRTAARQAARRAADPEMTRLERKTYRERAKQRPERVLHWRMSARMNAAIRGGKGGASWVRLVDYTIEELRAHLERQFLKGMSWENMGEWHIDHIVPVSSFDLQSADDPNFKRAWALTNLRPLWGKDNMRKSDKVLTLL